MYGCLGKWLLAVAGIAGILAPQANACPGCKPTGLTLSDEMAEMDAAIVGRLVESAPVPNSAASAADVQPAVFEVARVLKGSSPAHVGDRLQAAYFGSGKPGSLFLIMGIKQPQTLWSTPIPLTERAVEYVAELTKLPQGSLERYRFVLDYLEDEDSVLSRDAYDEMAKASYSAVRSLKDQLRPSDLLARIDDPKTPAARRRLYLVMLGVAGGETEVPLVEEMLRSNDRQQRRGLDMLIFCYLSLRGERGLPLIEERFLRNKDCDYSDTYAAIAAIRFQAAEGVTLSPQQAARSLQAVLERPDLADLVIPDLTRWGDWTAMDRLMGLFKSADEKSSWVRMPVINYLRACPLPRAKELLAECEKIDPLSVKRAYAFFPEASPSSAANGDFPGAIDARNEPRLVTTETDAVPVAFHGPIPQTDADPEGDTPASQTSARRTDPAGTNVASINPGVAPARALKMTPAARPNLWLLFGVPMIAGAALWVLQSSILRGRIGRG